MLYETDIKCPICGNELMTYVKKYDSETKLPLLTHCKTTCEEDLGLQKHTFSKELSHELNKLCHADLLKYPEAFKNL